MDPHADVQRPARGSERASVTAPASAPGPRETGLEAFFVHSSIDAYRIAVELGHLSWGEEDPPAGRAGDPASASASPAPAGHAIREPARSEACPEARPETRSVRWVTLAAALVLSGLGAAVLGIVAG